MVGTTSVQNDRVRTIQPLRALALVTVLAGATSSLAFMLYVGRHNPSFVLMLLFTVWVLFPFAALIVASVFSRAWPVAAQKALYIVMLVVPLASLAIYGDVAFGPPRPKPAAAFLMVPLVSLLLSALVVWIANRATQKLPGASG